MVSTLMRSSLREIRKSLGRYLAILAIIGLGVGFFAGVRMAQPDMLATGVQYLAEQNFYDVRLLSTLGFTEEDIDFFAGLGEVDTAKGAVYTEFLYQDEEGVETVLMAHSLTNGISTPRLAAGRMPEKNNECIGDVNYFTEADIGRTIRVSESNSEDTRELFAYEEYTLVGIAWSPNYLNLERGTASIGSGSISAFVLIPEDGFDFEAYYEIYLTLSGMPEAYSEAYDDRMDILNPQLERFAEERGDLRYTTIYEDALAEIRDGEQELKDGWEEYRTERTDAEAELTDAYKKLTDGEQEYADGLADYEQGKLDYANGLKQYEDALVEIANAEQELKDGWAEYYDGKANAEAELNDAHQKLLDGEAEYTDGLAQLQATQAKLAEGRTQLEAAELQLAQLEAQLKQLESAYGTEHPTYQAYLTQYQVSRTELDASWQELLAGEQAVAAAEQTLSTARAELDAGWVEYYDGKAEAEQELADAYQKLLDGEQELADGKQELADAKRELDDARAELDKAPGELADARAELDDGWAEYYDGKAEADREFADAESELTDGEQEIADAYEQLNDLEYPDVFVLTRKENTGYVCFDNDTSIIAAISVVFPVFFFLVAALVCMTTMTRMVDEQRTQTGVLKALGYSNRQIMGKYLFYSGSAALVGCVVGYAAGSIALPWVIWEIYAILYSFADLIFLFDPVLATISFAAALLCSMGSTWLACRVDLAQPSAELIRPKAPKAGKRVFLEYITPLWKRLSFLQKVSVRNVLRYRSRLIMMIIGIGGCTALLVTGFGLRDSITTILDDQYEHITLYDHSVTFREGQTAESATQYLTERGWTADEAALVHSGSVDVTSDNGTKSVYLTIPSSGSLGSFIDLHSGETPIPFPGMDEVVINVGLAEHLGISVGDTVELHIDNVRFSATVSAIYDHYIFHYAYLSPETYEKHLGNQPEYQTLYLLSHEGADPYEEGVALADSEDVSNVTVNAALIHQFSTMLGRMDLIVVVVVICAAALAFIVLYNLTNINITERIREIATIKVLGFYQKETASYVFREIRMLAVAGSLFGLLLGKALHSFVMAQVKVDGFYFPGRIVPSSYLLSVLLTIVFTILITNFMRPKLRKVDMAESLKSIE